MNRIDEQNSLTPAAQESLDMVVEEYRKRILEEAELRAVPAPGGGKEISVRDILESVDRIRENKRLFRNRRWEAILWIYSIVGMMMLMIGLAIFAYGKTGFSLSINQQIALIITVVGLMVFSLPVFLRKWRSIVKESSEFSDGRAIDASFVFIRKWDDIERVLRSHVEKSGESDYRHPFSFIVRVLQSDGTLSDSDTERLRFLLNLRNEIVHEVHRIDRDKIDIALKEADKLVKRFKSKSI